MSSSSIRSSTSDSARTAAPPWHPRHGSHGSSAKISRLASSTTPVSVRFRTSCRFQLGPRRGHESAWCLLGFAGGNHADRAGFRHVFSDPHCLFSRNAVLFHFSFRLWPAASEGKEQAEAIASRREIAKLLRDARALVKQVS